MMATRHRQSSRPAWQLTCGVTWAVRPGRDGATRVSMSKANPASSGPLDTGKVAGQRVLQFESIDQMLAEVDRLVEAERAGRLRRLGNWTLGQTLGHLAAWAEYGYTGAPLKVPFFIRWILRLRKQQFLYGPMRAGVKIPRVEGGTLATDPVPLDAGLGGYPRW